MTTYILPPGAWLSGTAPGGAGLWPPVEGSQQSAASSAGLWPWVEGGASANAAWWPEPLRRGARFAAGLWPDPPGGTPTSTGLWPDPPGGVPTSAAQWPDPPAGGAPWGPPRPWLGIDPTWVYAGGDAALRAQALRRVRTRIVQSQDPRMLTAITPAGALQPAPQALWRWQRPFRLKAVEAELMGRVVVHKRQVWWVPAPAALLAVPPEVPQPSFSLVAPDAVAQQPFNYDVQIDKVLRAAVEREERMPEILSQASDIGFFFDALTGIDRSQAPRLSELLEVVWEVTTQVLMALKHDVAEWRPVQRSAAVQPVIATPGHGSLPSGHAAMATVAAAVLSSLLYTPGSPRALQLDRLARRIAFNRVVAGVHFQMDSMAGYALGLHLAALFEAAATGAALPPAVTHTAHEEDSLSEDEGPPTPPASARAGQAAKAAPAAALVTPAPAAPAPALVPHAPLLGQLWQAAVAEVAQRRV